MPSLTKSIISISKLIEDNHITIEFVANMYFIKDKKMEMHLAQGIARGRLDQLLSKNDFVSNSCNLIYVLRYMLSVFNNSACNLPDIARNKNCTPQFHVNKTKSANLFH